MRILHFSDVHVDVSPFTIPIRDWLSKRLVGGANHLFRRGKKFRESRAKLRALGAFAEANGVELAICTGDYTILGTDVEFAAARELVEPLTTRPLGYVTVPGNHDIYLHDGVRERRFEKYFDKFLVSDLPELAAPSGWPLVRLFGDDVAVIALRSARPNPRIWLSSGRVDEEELAALGRMIEDARVRSRFVVIATHYALRRSSGEPDRARHGLDNAEDVLRTISRLPRGCVLHGHIHERFKLSLPGVRPTIFGAGSATQRGSEGFWMFDLGKDVGMATPGRWIGDRYELEESLATPVTMKVDVLAST